MKMVTNETELRNALKERAPEITIVTSYADTLAKQLGISPHQLSYVTHTNSGEGLLFFGNTTIPFVDRFPQNTELYAIMTTRPEDKKQEMNRA